MTNDPETLARLVAAEHSNIEISTPGDITTDEDGTPDGIDAPRETRGRLGRVRLAPHQWETIARYYIEKDKNHDHP